MAKVNFFLKEPNIKGETLVYLFLSYNNNRLKYSTGEKINTDYWNFEIRRLERQKSFPNTQSLTQG